MAPFAKAVPLTVTLTVELAGVVFGVTPRMFNCAVVGVIVMVGNEGAKGVSVTVGRLAVGVLACVFVGKGVTVATVDVGATTVNVCVMVNVGIIGETASVADGIGEAVGVITMGLPNSRHPRSGAAPIYPVSSPGGISSPLAAVYWMTPS